MRRSLNALEKPSSFHIQKKASARRPARKVSCDCFAIMRKLGQNFNSAGIRLFVNVLAGDNSLAVPHISVPDISWVDWEAFHKAGFRGCIFDKDNTLTNPYALQVHPDVVESLNKCKQTFADSIVLFSNSAGLSQYDPEGTEANRLANALGIPVLRHKQKKPAGTAEEIEAFFGCKADKLIMIGDRFLTDIVFGNRNKMLTLHVKPFDTTKEPVGVKVSRRIEDVMVGRWKRGGVKAPIHPLLTSSNVMKFVKQEKVT